MRYTDQQLLACNPFPGEREEGVSLQRVRLVTTRSPHPCIMGLFGEAAHEIPAGSRARYETALVDGNWGSFHMCLPCVERQIQREEAGGD